MPLKQAEIECYLLTLGFTQKVIDAAEAKGLKAMDDLARSGSAPTGLRDEDLIKKVYLESKEAAKAKVQADLEKRLTPLSKEERYRYRLAFDHFDADSSGELDEGEVTGGLRPRTGIGWGIQEYRVAGGQCSWKFPTRFNFCGPKPQQRMRFQ